MKLISIITPIFNREDVFYEFLSSIQNQTYDNWELIIVDDCSTDGSYTMAIESSLSDSRIRVYKNATNMGVAFSRNKAIEKARGKYIAFLDSDDLWETTKLEKQVRFMEDNNINFSYTEYYGSNKKDRIISGPSVIYNKKMKLTCWIGCLTVMYNAEIIGKVYSPLIKRRNDYAMWLKISENNDCFLLKEPLATYHLSENSISNVRITKKIKSNIILYKEVYKANNIISFYYSIRNIIWTIFRKIRYTKKNPNP